MAKKIILFLSAARPNAAELEYECPDGKAIKGTNTNEAPVGYLLRAHRDVKQILCILTTQAQQTAWQPLQDYVHRLRPNVELIPIQMELDDDFNAEPLHEILRRVRPGDKILLETSGGLRNTIMDILLLSRVLSYTGVKVLQAVYSNFQKKRIEDISHLLEQFDLVNGMETMKSFGKTDALKRYYENRTDAQAQDILALIDAMEQLSNNVMLCRTNRLDGDMQRFNQAMDQIKSCDDPLLQVLLPVFRQKFKGKLTFPGLIRFCADNGMLQQGVTIYNERMADYLLAPENHIMALDIPLDPTGDTLSTEANRRLKALFSEMSRESSGESCTWYKQHPKYASQKIDRRISMMDEFDTLIDRKGAALYCVPGRLLPVVMDYHYVRMLRNLVNHASDHGDVNEPLQVYLHERQGRKLVNALEAEDLRAILRDCAEHLDQVMTAKH